MFKTSAVSDGRLNLCERLGIWGLVGYECFGRVLDAQHNREW